MKTDLIICEQNCDTCPTKDSCPMKGRCPLPPNKEGDILMPPIVEIFMKKRLEQLHDAIDPEWLLVRFDINLFNFIQGVDLLLKEGENFSQEDIEKAIKSIMHKDDATFFQLINSSFFDTLTKKIHLTIRIMAKTILDAVEENCSEEECQTCWLEGKCPQKGQLELYP